MTFTEEQIEWIVAEVLRRLRVAVGRDADHGSSASVSDADLRIEERLITMLTIETRLTGLKRVVVPQKAVVTPAVKDELKARKIELVYQRGER